MPRRGRPRKRKSLFSVRNYIEYTSDSDSDVNNIHQNVSYEIKHGSLQSIATGNQHQHQHQQISVDAISVDEEQAISANDEQLQIHVDAEVEQYISTGESIPVEHDFGEYISEAEEQPIYVHGANDLEMDNNDAINIEPQLLIDDVHDIGREQISSDEEADLESINGEEEHYNDILKELKSQWLLTEIDHCVSKTASEAFWKLSLLYFSKLANAIGKKKKTPLFKSIRKNMITDLVPKVDLEIGYRNRTSGEILVVKDTTTPLKRFPLDKFEKIYEIGTMDVSSKKMRPYFVCIYIST